MVQMVPATLLAAEHSGLLLSTWLVSIYPLPLSGTPSSMVYRAHRCRPGTNCQGQSSERSAPTCFHWLTHQNCVLESNGRHRRLCCSPDSASLIHTALFATERTAPETV